MKTGRSFLCTSLGHRNMAEDAAVRVSETQPAVFAFFSTRITFDELVNGHDRLLVTPTDANPPQSPFSKGGGLKNLRKIFPPFQKGVGGDFHGKNYQKSSPHCPSSPLALLRRVERSDQVSLFIPDSRLRENDRGWRFTSFYKFLDSALILT